ncbi:sigma-54-dependent transcriptional regulator [Paraliomyxa miuraensis]|uniref:sigma-54-dependent transcriptional regulator n=1 Tax=Paraliomyxa miuraensis TaxID=376150 RepID=UPI00225A4E14|nr:sigma-54 dependent transcriptional regulator [Paraliomyxa miuraensis]MCX4245941.1 sigma-54 dependent transcriptional regulator [Paraliomyxa miuraensis]
MANTLIPVGAPRRNVPDPLLEGRSVLIVDDHDAHRNLLTNYLGVLGCRCQGASGGNEALERMAATPFDLVLLDLRMDDLDGMEVLKRARARGMAANCIMMSAEGTISHAVDAIRLGATDFLVKPFELEQLTGLVRRVLGSLAPGDGTRQDPRLAWRDTHAPDLIGEHPRLLDVFLVIERIANTDCTVLVLGESGTGKELVARAIHNTSGRKGKPFVPVNCGAIPETLIESELFGHAKGAFSGATSAREGRFAVADGGTLFLDEIGEMSLAVQVKFLRVLQEQEYVPVGETRPRKCDVRIIAATNKNLEQMTREGTFREDLFYRLNLIPIHLPALRERIEDVPRLAQHFLGMLGTRTSQPTPTLSPPALELMTRYEWPGNVRELQNTVERMTLLHQGGGMLDLGDLPPKIQSLSGRSTPFSVVPAAPPSSPVVEIRAPPPAGPAASAAPPTPTPVVAEVPTAANTSPPPRDPAPVLAPEDFVLPNEGIDLRKAVQAFEMSLIDQALARTGGNKNQASMLLGMNRTTLVEKLRKRQR